MQRYMIKAHNEKIKEINVSKTRFGIQKDTQILVILWFFFVREFYFNV